MHADVNPKFKQKPLLFSQADLNGTRWNSKKCIIFSELGFIFSSFRLIFVELWLMYWLILFFWICSNFYEIMTNFLPNLSIFLVHFWSTFDPFLVYFWSIFGLFVSYFCSILHTFWPIFNPNFGIFHFFLTPFSILKSSTMFVLDSSLKVCEILNLFLMTFFTKIYCPK